MPKSLYHLPYLHDFEEDVTKTWYIAYSIYNPLTDRMVRKRITEKINNGSAKSRLEKSAQIIAELEDKLQAGWWLLAKIFKY